MPEWILSFSLEKDSVHSGISLQKGAFVVRYGFTKYPDAKGGGVLTLAKTNIQTYLESTKFLSKEAQLVQFVFNGITIFGVYKNPTKNNLK